MPTFNYKARDKYGVDVVGSIESSSSDTVAGRLKEMGYTPLNITQQQASFSDSISEYFSGFQKIRQDEMLVFVRQLSSILNAGVPLLESLEAVYEQVSSSKFKKVIFSLRKDIEGGASFSEALSAHKKVFSPVFVSMVRAGEKAGILGDVLDRLANLMEKDYENTQKIKSATRYPLIVVIALSIAFVIVVTYIIPQFAKLYANFKAQLPLPTRILIGINFVIVNYWYVILTTLAAALFSFKRFIDTPPGRLALDRFLLSVPIFGDLLSKLILARFCRMLSNMLKSGIPIVEALGISSGTVENRIVSDVIDGVRNEVVKGSGLSEPMKGAKVFPPIVVQMVAIGEKSGSLESMLAKVADYFDRDADYTIRNLTPLLEPLLILILAFFVVLLALGVFLPMWDMVKIVKS
jgi:type II secretory pathway component PulF